MSLPKILLLNSLRINKVPFSLIHFVTDKCNMRCGHCFIYGDFEGQGDDQRYPDDNTLTLTEIETLTLSLKGGLGVVSLTGGEPLLRDDLLEIAKLYAKNAGARIVEVSTNGWYGEKLEEFVPAFLDAAKSELFISLSFDGLKESHDKLRAKEGAFERAIESAKTILAMKKDRVQLSATITVTEQSPEEIEELFHFLIDDVKIDAITSSAFRGEPKSDGRLNFNMESYKLLNRLIEDHMLSGSITPFSNYAGRDLINARGVLARRRVEETLDKNKYITPCTAGRSLVIVYSDGSVYPCEILQKKMGELREYDMDLPALLKSKNARTIIKEIHHIKCFCSFECAWTYNTIFEMKNWRALFKEYLKIKRRTKN